MMMMMNDNDDDNNNNSNRQILRESTTLLFDRCIHRVPKRRPTLSFAVTLTCLYQNGQNLAYKKKKLRATKRT